MKVLSAQVTALTNKLEVGSGKQMNHLPANAASAPSNVPSTLRTEGNKAGVTTDAHVERSDSKITLSKSNAMLQREMNGMSEAVRKLIEVIEHMRAKQTLDDASVVVDNSKPVAISNARSGGHSNSKSNHASPNMGSNRVTGSNIDFSNNDGSNSFGYSTRGVGKEIEINDVSGAISSNGLSSGTSGVPNRVNTLVLGLLVAQALNSAASAKKAAINLAAMINSHNMPPNGSGNMLLGGANINESGSWQEGNLDKGSTDTHYGVSSHSDQNLALPSQMNRLSSGVTIPIIPNFDYSKYFYARTFHPSYISDVLASKTQDLSDSPGFDIDDDIDPNAFYRGVEHNRVLTEEEEKEKKQRQSHRFHTGGADNEEYKSKSMEDILKANGGHKTAGNIGLYFCNT